MLVNNLYKKFISLISEDFYYYNDNEKRVPDILYLMESEVTSYKFILDYSKSGSKEKLADCFNKEILQLKGIINTKHRHSVALYYLGCHLKNILNPFISRIYSRIDCRYKKPSSFEFLYTWFLTCLYHDLAAPLENKIDKK